MVQPRAKRIIFRIDRKTYKPVVVIPVNAGVSQLRACFDAYHAWMKRIGASEKIRVDNGIVMPFLGRDHQIIFVTNPLLMRAQIHHDAEKYLLHVQGRRDHAKALWSYFQEQARIFATQASQRYAQQLGATLGRIQVRDLTSMWGRCMSQRDLCYAWRLILAPVDVFEYVCAHEVAHCVHPNHSRAFWQTVHDLHPNVDACEHWLKKNGPSLFRYFI